MISTNVLILLLCVLHVIFLLPVSSENININGTRGAPVFWTCFYTSIEPFYPKEYYIFWQGQHESNIVVHAWSKGKQESKYQTPSFRNRTKIFPDQLSSGNLSLVIEPLMLEDDQLSLEVTVSGNKPTKKLCQMTLYIAAPFQEPNIEINKTEMTATCSTKGGYPKSELKWSSGDGGTGLEPCELETNITVEEDATYSISSTVNITGFQKVTCRVYNPTSNQTLSATKDIQESPANRHHIWIIGVVPFIIFIIVCMRLIILRSKSQQRPPAPSAEGEDLAEGIAYHAPSMSSRSGSDSNDSINQGVVHRSPARRGRADADGAAADGADGVGAEQETQFN